MDDFVAFLQAKLGPMTFGAIMGFVLQVLIFRPKNWVLAAERALAAIVTAIIFTTPMLRLIDWIAPGLDRDVALTTSAAVLALGGVELVRTARNRFIKAVGGETKDE